MSKPVQRSQSSPYINHADDHAHSLSARISGAAYEPIREAQDSLSGTSQFSIEPGSIYRDTHGDFVSKEPENVEKQQTIRFAREYGYQGNDYAQADTYLKTKLTPIIETLDGEGYLFKPCLFYDNGQLDIIISLKKINHRFRRHLLNKLSDALECHLADVNFVKFLIFLCGSDPNHKSKDGMSPLHSAAKNGYVESLNCLLQYGAYENIQNNEIETPLHFAASAGHSECVRILLRNDANPNNQNSEGHTPLHQAALHGHAECVKLLLQSKADSSIPARKDKKRALHYAKQHGHDQCVQYLLQFNADPYVQDLLGNTPLDCTKGDTIRS